MGEILTPAEMNVVDEQAIKYGPFNGYRLMCNAGAAVAAEIPKHFPAAAGYDVLCGPGNNGGDGYVVARLLAERGLDVRLWRNKEPKEGSDASRAASQCPLSAKSLAAFVPDPARLVVDALYGAGLSRSVTGLEADIIAQTVKMKAPVISVDLPSGISGTTGNIQGCAFHSALTVSFFRKKPGHVLYPGRSHCGEIVIADIGIADELLLDAGIQCHENTPALWQALLATPSPTAHKYMRGHVAVFSGGISSTGAARLAALGAARIGAGAVTLLSPQDALAANAAHLTAIMLCQTDTWDEVETFNRQRKPASFVFGPGFGVSEKTRRFALALMQRADAAHPLGVVLDADAISAFSHEPDALFSAAGKATAPILVLTPHEGEFARLFPDLTNNASLSKLERAREAAQRSSSILVFKGPDTVIAAPDNRAAININGSPLLATAGSGDVLAGIIAGLIAQKMPAFEAACAAVWLHAEAANIQGAGLIAEDLPNALPQALARLNKVDRRHI